MKKTREEHIQSAVAVHGNKYDYSKTEFVFKKGGKSLIVCPMHGEFLQRWDSHLAGSGCKKCAAVAMSTKISKTTEEFVEESKNKYPGKFSYEKTFYKHSFTPVTVTCVKHGDFSIAPHHHITKDGAGGCKECAKLSQRTATKKENSEYIKDAMAAHGDRYDYSKTICDGVMNEVTIICPVHGEFRKNAGHHIYYKQGCQLCKETYTKDEEELGKFLHETYPDVNFTMRETGLLEGKKELDFYFPNNKAAIEIDGVYWHSEEKKGRSAHKIKKRECLERGISLLQVWDVEWLRKKDLVKSMISASIGKFERRIFARKCRVDEVPYDIAKTFVESNHIQGHIPAVKYIGLFYNDELVAIMTFGNNRPILKQEKKENEWELYRFCSLKNTQVIGGAGKMFSFFVKKYLPKKVISFMDMRYGTGKVYELLGMKEIGWSEPNFYYVKGYKMFSRHRFKKHLLIQEGFDKSLSGNEIMKQRGFSRLYDSGCKKYLWTSCEI